MPRRARPDAAGTLHHIILRGIEKRRIFVDDLDRSEGAGIADERQQLGDGADQHLPVIADRQASGNRRIYLPAEIQGGAGYPSGSFIGLGRKFCPHDGYWLSL